MIFRALLSLLRIVLDIWSLLCLNMNFIIFFSISCEEWWCFGWRLHTGFDVTEVNSPQVSLMLF